MVFQGFAQTNCQIKKEGILFLVPFFSLKAVRICMLWFNKYFRTQFGVKIFSAAIAASQHAVCIFIPTQIVTVVSLKKGLCSILFRKFPHSWQHNDKPPITVFVATVTF